jgi:hypothetical protein
MTTKNITDLSCSTTLNMIRREMDEALAKIGARHGVSFNLGSMRYDGDGSRFTVKTECLRRSEDGTVETKEAKDFTRLAHLYGLKPEHLGVTVTMGGEHYRISGLSTRSRKYPILAMRLKDGKTYKFTEPSIVSAVQRSGNWGEE